MLLIMFGKTLDQWSSFVKKIFLPVHRMHFWLVSAPAERSKDATFSTLKKTLGELPTNHAMRIPDLKVGTLDSLMVLASGELTQCVLSWKWERKEPGQ